MDEDVPPLKPTYMVGQDISAFSVEELAESISLLKHEIARLERARDAKLTTRNAAEALFRRN
ncbi:DUF1192 domain-containing protein [Chelativorans composti]|jgi:Uncharacterized small protein containing a coiled-coil domain|uniref:DUF1192 domain-containing protein n=1 Tax=Chelativorans composti TaxID=768533 RepID=A0ABW5DJK4_9HYPH